MELPNINRSELIEPKDFVQIAWDFQSDCLEEDSAWIEHMVDDLDLTSTQLLEIRNRLTLHGLRWRQLIEGMVGYTGNFDDIDS